MSLGPSYRTCRFCGLPSDSIFHDCEKAEQKAYEERILRENGTIKLGAKELRLLADHENENISKAAREGLEKMKEALPVLRRVLVESIGEEKADAMIRAEFEDLVEDV